MQALYQLEQITAQTGWTPELFRLAGDLWQEAGDGGRAFTYWRATGIRDDAAFLRQLGNTALELGEWNAAQTAFAQLMALEPDDGRARTELGILLAANGDRAVVDLLSRIANDPASPDAETADALISALQGADDLGSRLIRVGLIFAERERWQYAVLAFESAAALPDAPALAYAYLGWSQDQTGEDGTDAILQAVNAAPNDAQVRLLEGLHWRSLGENDASLEALIAAAVFDPESAALLAELGNTYRLMRDFDQARYWYTLALALSNNDARYQALLDLLNGNPTEVMGELGLNDATPELTP